MALLLNLQGIEMTALNDLQASVANEDTIIASALTLIQGFSAQLAAAGTDSDALAQLKVDIDSRAQALAAAVQANTPAATLAPGATAPVATVPMETVPIVGGVPVSPAGSSTASDPSGNAAGSGTTVAPPFVDVPSLPVDPAAAPVVATDVPAAPGGSGPDRRHDPGLNDSDTR